MVFQLATPVHNNRIAPRAIAITLVSPIEPGIKPVTMSHEKAGQALAELATAALPKAVAPEKPSTTLPAPIPQIESVATQTASPDIFAG